MLVIYDMGVNTVILAGYVGSEPNVYSKNDFKVAKFSIGTSAYRNKQKVTDWHNVESFGSSATYVENYIHKGDYVVVSGFLTTTTFKTKDGTEMKVYGVKVSSVEKPRVNEEANRPEVRNEEHGSTLSVSPRVTPDSKYDDDLPY